MIMKKNKPLFCAAIVCALSLAALMTACGNERPQSSVQPIMTTAAEPTATSDEPTTAAPTAKASASAAETKPKEASAKKGSTKEKPSEEPGTEPRVYTVGDFAVINQMPELPTGCEITSLAMVLNHLGCDCDKLDLAENYLDKGELGKTDPRKAFIGDPTSNRDSRGCYAPVIADTANKYLEAQGFEYRAKDVSGSELEELFEYIRSGTPVIIWGTMDCAPIQPTDVWEIDGEIIQWLRPEHCTVLVGYDDTKIFLADPYFATVKPYDTEVFRTVFNGMHKQAVVIE